MEELLRGVGKINIRNLDQYETDTSSTKKITTVNLKLGKKDFDTCKQALKKLFPVILTEEFADLYNRTHGTNIDINEIRQKTIEPLNAAFESLITPVEKAGTTRKPQSEEAKASNYFGKIYSPTVAYKTIISLIHNIDSLKLQPDYLEALTIPKAKSVLRAYLKQEDATIQALENVLPEIAEYDSVEDIDLKRLDYLAQKIVGFVPKSST
jgi:hypothetical protein